MVPSTDGDFCKVRQDTRSQWKKRVTRPCPPTRIAVLVDPSGPYPIMMWGLGPLPVDLRGTHTGGSGGTEEVCWAKAFQERRTLPSDNPKTPMRPGLATPSATSLLATAMKSGRLRSFDAFASRSAVSCQAGWPLVPARATTVDAGAALRHCRGPDFPRYLNAAVWERRFSPT